MKKYLLAAVITVFAYAQIAFSADINEPEYLIFIGNPGVGKSTLINSLVGRHVAESGVSAGIGMTKFFSAYEHEGRFYMDTPGLADMKLREQAAREIEAALKKNGKYRIFFVMTLESGRVKPEDVTTINTVMNAINHDKAEFNIILNKLSVKEKSKILAINTTDMAAIYAQINSGKHTTSSIRYIDNDRNIDDDITEFMTINAELKRFIFEESKSIKIASQDIGKIETDEFEAIKAQFADSMSLLQEEIKAGNKKHDELKSAMETIKTQLAEAKEDAKKVKEKAETDADIVKTDLERAKKDLTDERNKPAVIVCNLL